jgi:ABC-2 type transport system permease protein
MTPDAARPMATDGARPYGPSAFGADRRRFIELTLTLARTEFKLRYFGSVLGYFWSLLRPLLFFGVLYVFFVEILGISRGVPHFGAYLLTGVVLWNYFGEATGNCVACLLQREALLRKIRFPRMVIPLSVSVTAIFNLCLNFIVIVIYALIEGVTPTISWLAMIPIAIGFVIFATGLGTLLAALYVRFRDVDPIWSVAIQAWFYASPIMYLASKYSKLGTGFAKVMMCSPPATLIAQMGHAFIDPTAYPSAVTAAHGYLSVIIALALIPATFALGWWYFAREAPRVAENL